MNESLRERLPLTLAATLAAGTLLLLALAVSAFWPNYLARPFAAIDGYTHFHAVAGLTWLLLLIMQALLIRGGRRRLHRALGRASYVAAPAFATSGLLLAHFRFSRMNGSAFAAEAFTLYLPLAAVLLFAAAYALGIAYRRSAQVHARCMACTSLLLIDPVLGRTMAFYLPEFPALWYYQVVTFGAASALAYLATRSLPRGTRGRPAFIAFVTLFIGVLGAWFFVPRTPPWLAFATWFRELPLT